MIVPMKKVTLVVMDKNREVSLEKLRELGIIHLEKRNVSSDRLAKLLERKARVENALGMLFSYPLKKRGGPVFAAPVSPPVPAGSAGEDFSSDSVNVPEVPDPVDQVLALAEERKSLQEQLGGDIKERSRIEKWGDFNPPALKDLADQGLSLIPYELSWESYESLGDAVPVIVLFRDKSSVFCAAVGASIPGEIPLALPSRSLSELDRRIAETRDALADIEGQLGALAYRQGAVGAELKRLVQDIEFEAARVGMDTIEDAPAEFTVSWITGFVPKDDVGLLKRAAVENSWALFSDDPGEEDLVPTKLKNGRIASLINPLTEFLEVMPGYREVDISGWFLLFFCVFFGMIFGDAGYGALLLLGSLAGIIKTSKKGVPPMLKLALLLGASNFVWGVLTCSWFGIEDLQMLPPLLRNLSLPLISNVRAAQSPRDKSIVQQNLMIFCFSLALLQLSVGHILAIIKGRTLKALGDLGSMAMVAGMYCVVLSLIASNEYRRIPLFMPAVYVFMGGFLLNFLFANYEGSFGRSVLESLKNIISVILGIANVFSDIMSYIRLWAVGLAGAAIASTVNAMAGPMLGRFAFFIFGVVLLVFGHGLNIILNLLSVLVHGVRLNTLEFSSHVGLTWSGYAYRPFAKRIEKEAQSG